MVLELTSLLKQLLFNPPQKIKVPQCLNFFFWFKICMNSVSSDNDKLLY